MPKVADLPNLVNLSKEVNNLLRMSVEPYTLMVRNTMTNNTSTLAQSTPAAAMKLPLSQTRRMACTHLTMRRYYGDLRCPICRRDPDLGYTYLCTQDESECLSSEMDVGSTKPTEADVMLHQPGSDEVVGTETRPYTQLSPWIEKAIAKGEYSQEQIAMLRAQKQKVNDTIAAALDHFKDSDSSECKKPPIKSPSVDANSYLPFPVINEVEEAPTATLLKPKEKADARILPYCEFRACQTCRPTFRDRAWQKFEDVFTDPKAPRIDFANDNRPLSNPYIITRIGLHEPTARPRLRTFDSFSLYQSDRLAKRDLTHATARHSPSMNGSNDIADQRVEPGSRGFRDSVKRAFRGMLLTRRDSMASKRSSRSSRLMSRKMRVQEEEPSEDRVDFDMGLWKELNDELLRVASNVKLPGHDGMDGLEAQAEEVEVGNGVAVTEEAVDMGTADIIMAV